MSFNSIKTKAQSERGFTIVELLIVIVVIGILAAITIVAYNGVTARANTTAAAAVAATVAKKAEAYNAEKSGYPKTLSLLTAAGDSGTSYYVPAGSVNQLFATITTSTPTAANKTTKDVTYTVCGTAASAAATDFATVTNVTGITVTTWDFAKSQVQTSSVGTITGTLPYTINCYIQAS